MMEANIWTKDEDLFQKGYSESLVVKAGTNPAYQADIFNLEFDRNHSVITLSGSTGSGKSAMVNLVLYNALSAYDPAALKVMLYDFKAVEFQNYQFHPFPHFVQLPMYGRTDEEWNLFLTNAAAYVKEHNYRMLLVVLDEYAALTKSEKLMDKLYTLLDIIEDAPDTYALLSTQAPNHCRDILRQYSRRMLLRSSEKVSELVLGSPCAAYAPAKFGYVYYAEDMIVSPNCVTCYKTPFVPYERFWDMEGLTKRKLEGKAPADATTLQYRAVERWSGGDRAIDSIQFCAPVPVAVGRKIPHAIIPTACYDKVWTYLQNSYTDLTLLTLNPGTQWNIMERMQKRVTAISVDRTLGEREYYALHTPFALMCADPSALDSVVLETLVTLGSMCNFHIFTPKPLPATYSNLVLDVAAVANKQVDGLPFDSTRDGLKVICGDKTIVLADDPAHVQVPREKFWGVVEEMFNTHKDLVGLPLTSTTAGTMVYRMSVRWGKLQAQGVSRYKYHRDTEMSRVLMVCENPASIPRATMMSIFKMGKQVGFHAIFARDQADADLQSLVYQL